MQMIGTNAAPAFVRARLLRRDALTDRWLRPDGKTESDPTTARRQELPLDESQGSALRDANPREWAARYEVMGNVLVLFFEKVTTDEFSGSTGWIAHFVDPVTQEIRTWPRELVLVSDFAGDKK